MTIRIDLERCDGCGKLPEAPCEAICPGDLLHRAGGKIRLREPAACWDCFACVKACPREALCIQLPPGLSQSCHCLSARIGADHILWKMHTHQGRLINQCRIPNRVLSTGPPGTKSPDIPGQEKPVCI